MEPMTRLGLVLRSVLFHHRALAAVLAAAALASAIPVGALLVGDSVRFTLQQSALRRLGGVTHVIHTPQPLFQQDLAARLSLASGMPAASALLLPAVALREEGGDQALQVHDAQVFGIDADFGGAALLPGQGGAVINQGLAARLGLHVGQRLSLRVALPSSLPHDAPLAARGRPTTVRASLLVERIVADLPMADFALRADHRPPCNVFVERGWLQQWLGAGTRANLLTLRSPHMDDPTLQASLARVWLLEDAGLSTRAAPGGVVQLDSTRVFLDPALAQAAASLPDAQPVGALSYLVNGLTAASGASTPYSFVLAIEPSAQRGLSPVPSDMADDEILVNRWLADGLQVGAGATLRLDYFALTPSNTFAETSRTFRVRGVVEMADLCAEADLAPHFPGLTDADRCADWDIGLPLDKAKISDAANEAYWHSYRATPKAIVTLKAGQAMWGNRFGNLTALRFGPAAGLAETWMAALAHAVDPRLLGLSIQPLAAQAQRAAAEAMDFGELFLGLSFFLIAAALLLVALLFSLGIQTRAAEVGLLLALGFGRLQVAALFLAEGCTVAALGCAAGAALGSLYTRALLWGLARQWHGAVADAAIQYHAEPRTLVLGVLAAFVCASLAVVAALWRQTRRPLPLLLGRQDADDASERVPRQGRLVGMLSLLAAVAALVVVFWPHAEPAPAFLGAGALLLGAGLGAVWQGLGRAAQGRGALTLVSLGLRAAARRRTRSLGVVASLACGSFLVLAVASMQEDAAAHAELRSSGTGGFSLYAEATLPIDENRRTSTGRARLRLDQEPALTAARIVPLRVQDGDDASCLNLHHAQTPRLLGVDPRDMAQRHAFVDAERAKLWSLLDAPQQDGAIPALAGDADTATWGLRKRADPEHGDTLTYTDEAGRRLLVRLVGTLPMRLSLFQGSLLISERAFLAHFPSQSGARVLLVDAAAAPAAAAALSRRLGRFGLDIVPSAQRLRAFGAVEAAYMAVFLVLGALGLLLGSIGTGIVVARNLLERRAELALLAAVGFAPRQIRRVVLVESWLTLGAGIGLGVVASLVAMLPSLRAPGAHPPWLAMGELVLGIVVLQAAWIAVCVRWASARAGVADLRGE